jgi:hypothetical protein
VSDGRHWGLRQVVQESRTPALGGFTFGEVVTHVLSRIFPEPKRPLRPNPRPRAPANVLVDHCALLVQLIGGRNIPLRAHAEKTPHDARRKRPSRPSLAEHESSIVGEGGSQADEAKFELDAEKLEDRSGYTCITDLRRIDLCAHCVVFDRAE